MGLIKLITMLDLKLFLQSHNETLSALYKMKVLEINFTLVNGLYQGKQLNIFLILDLGFNFNLHNWPEFHHHLKESWVLSWSSLGSRDWMPPNEKEPFQK